MRLLAEEKILRRIFLEYSEEAPKHGLCYFVLHESAEPAQGMARLVTEENKVWPLDASAMENAYNRVEALAIGVGLPATEVRAHSFYLRGDPEASIRHEMVMRVVSGYSMYLLASSSRIVFRDVRTYATAHSTAPCVVSTRAAAPQLGVLLTRVAHRHARAHATDRSLSPPVPVP